MNAVKSNNGKLAVKFFIISIIVNAAAVLAAVLIFPESKGVIWIGILISVISIVCLLITFRNTVTEPLNKLKDQLTNNNTETELNTGTDSNSEINSLAELINETLFKWKSKGALAESIVTGLMSPLFLVDMDSRITHANDSGATFLGYRREEIIGKTIKEIFGSDAATRSTIAGKPVHNHVSMGHDKQGKPIKFLVNTSLLKDHKHQPAGVAIFCLDLKEEEVKQKEMIIMQSRSLAQALEALAKGDLTMKVDLDKESYLYELSLNLENSISELNNAFANVMESVNAAAAASNQISSSSEEMAAGAQEQSAQTTEVAVAVEEMTRTIIETAKNSSRASDAAKNAGSIAKEGGRVVNETIKGMNRIAEVVKSSAETVHALGNSSDQIGEIVQVIDDIADQTNLLALNAAIEAARAGEQGRGFAVVADEVRKLAERTTKATKEIAAMIKQIQKDTEGAVSSMNLGTAEVEKGINLAAKAGQSLTDIIAGADDVLNMVTQVAAASEEQSSTAEQISKNIEAITQVTNESAQGLQQIARASENLNSITENLQQLTSRFKIDGAGTSDRKLPENPVRRLK